jgi:hypothetical protein
VRKDIAPSVARNRSRSGVADALCALRAEQLEQQAAMLRDGPGGGGGGGGNNGRVKVRARGASGSRCRPPLRMRASTRRYRRSLTDPASRRRAPSPLPLQPLTPQDVQEALLDLREHDVPYHVRFAIDTGVRAGHWYTVKAEDGRISLTHRCGVLGAGMGVEGEEPRAEAAAAA